MIRTVLIDDEPPARRKLKHLLSTESDVAIVGEAASGAEAVELLNRVQPDLAFLDIQLPDCTGFEVIESLEDSNRLTIVFVTAHDDFALRAFDLNAVDYLLKPVEPSRFLQTLKRVRHHVGSPGSAHLASRLDALMKALRSDQTYPRRLLIQDGDRSIFLEVGRIDWIEAARNYVCLHVGERTHVSRSSLDSIATKLDPALFRRINRSEIVNLSCIAEVRAWFHGDQKLLLKTGKELNWSRRYRTDSVDDLERA